MKHLTDNKALASKESFDRFLEKYFGRQADTFIAALNSRFNELLRSDIKQADKFLKRSKRAFNYLPLQYHGRLLALEARYCQYTGNNRDAAKRYEAALKYNSKFREFEANARLRKGLMNVYMYLGRYKDAIKAGRLALRYFLGRKNSKEAGQIYNNIGNIYFRMDNNRAALRYYNQARDVYKRTGGIPLAIIEFNLANTFSVSNDLIPARRLYSRAGNIYSETNNQIAARQADYSLAIIDFWENRYSAALVTFEKVLDQLQKLGDPRTAVIVQLDLIELYIELNLISNAVYQAEEVIKNAEKMEMKYETAKAHYMIARAALKSDDYEKAERSLKMAEKYFVSENNILWLGLVNFERSRLNLARHFFKRAERFAIKSVKLFSGLKEHYRVVQSRIILVEVKLKSGQPVSAFRLASRLLKSKLPGSQKQKLFYLIGLCLFEQKKYSQALKYFKKAIQLIEQNLELMYSDEIRFFYAADKYNVYKAMIRCYLKQGQTKKSYVSSLKALQVINQRSKKIDRWQRDIPRTLQTERDKLRAILKKFHLTPGEGSGKLRQVPAVSNIFSIEQKLWTVERKIRKLYETPERFRSVSKNSCFPTGKYIRNNERLLNFVELDNLIGVYVVTPDRQKYIQLPVPADKLRSDLHKLSFICERTILGHENSDKMKSDSDNILNRMYNYLLQPLEIYTAGKDLILLANGDFFQVPFAALCDNSGRYMKDICNLSLICNPTDLANRKSKKVNYLSSANAIFASGTENLPALKTEVQKIKQAFKKSNIYIDSGVTRNKLLSELQRADGFLHIAAHASRSSENPLFSKIILDDGPLFPFDIYGERIKPKLITLSGCFTAAPGLYYGNSFSLARAYYQAGSRFVLASLWPVSDKISNYFMIHFYRHLAKTNDIGSAYKKATDITAKTTDNPAFWGSFIVLGI
jgi:CHAT domain-containing protein